MRDMPRLEGCERVVGWPAASMSMKEEGKKIDD